MIGLSSVEVYNSIFDITEENNKLKLYTDSSYEISFVKLKDKVAEALGLSDISPEDLQHKTYGPDIIKTNRKLSIEKNQTDASYISLFDYGHSPFRDLESYLRIVLGLGEDDNQSI